MNNSNIRALIVLICSILIVASCGTSKKALVTVDPYSDIISSDCASGEPIALLSDMFKYPSHRERIEAKLYSINYSLIQYDTLLYLSAVAQDDFTASEFFDSLVYNREKKILDGLAEMSIQEIGNYYRLHTDEHPFLKNIIKESIMDNLPGKDYWTVRDVHEAFESSDLATYVEPIYNTMRQDLINDALSTMKVCYDEEDIILEAIEYSLRVDFEKYIHKGLSTIMYELNNKLDRGIIKKIFKREEKDKYTFEGYARKLIDEHLSFDYIGEHAAEKVNDYVLSSCTIRKDMLSSYFEDYNTCQKYYVQSDSLRFENQLIITDNEEASTIQGIRDGGTILSLASLALAFTPYGILSFAFDAADFAYGVTESSQIAPVLDSMASSLYSNTADNINIYLETVFNALREEKARSENYTKQRLYEVY